MTGGVARATVFGVSDGLVSNVSLILGVAGAGTTAAIVRTAGVAGLVAGAFSMAAGEYVSMKAQRELLERELAVERRELARHPHAETVELAHIYMARGVDPDTAREVAAEMMKDPETALEAHARDELGIDPSSLGSPWAAAGRRSSRSVSERSSRSSLGSSGRARTRSSRPSSSPRSPRRSSARCSPGSPADRSCSRPARQVAIAAVAASVTYGVGVMLGA